MNDVIYIVKRYKKEPTAGLEPAALTLRGSHSTD